MKNNYKDTCPGCGKKSLWVNPKNDVSYCYDCTHLYSKGNRVFLVVDDSDDASELQYTQVKYGKRL